MRAETHYKNINLKAPAVVGANELESEDDVEAITKNSNVLAHSNYLGNIIERKTRKQKIPQGPT